MILAIAIISSLLLGTDAQAPDTCTQAQVDARQQFCASCVDVVRCDAVDVAPVHVATCDLAGGFGCAPLGSNGACQSVTSTSPCACSTSKCDPFDDGMLLLCNTFIGFIGTGTCTENQTCIGTACEEVTTTAAPAAVDPPMCSELDPEQFGKITFVPPNCNDLVFCASADSEPIFRSDVCAEDEYVASDGSCGTVPVPTCDCGPSVLNCGDRLNCNIYYNCLDGSQVGGPLTCIGSTMYWNFVNNTCSSDNTTCDALSQCTAVVEANNALVTTTPAITSTTTTLGTNTTTTLSTNTTTTLSTDTTITTNNSNTTTATTFNPSTFPCNAATVNQIIPDTTDCTRYYKCYNTNTNVYELRRQTCPGAGSYLFDINTNRCQPASIATCAS